MLTGKKISYLDPSKEAYIEQMIASGMPEMTAGFMAAFGEAIANDELDTKQTNLPAILGRKPTSLHEYLRTAYSVAE